MTPAKVQAYMAKEFPGRRVIVKEFGPSLMVLVSAAAPGSSAFAVELSVYEDTLASAVRAACTKAERRAGA